MSNKTEKELGVKSVYFDADALVLFGDIEGSDDSIIEDWPSDWPEFVTEAFLTERGIVVI